MENDVGVEETAAILSVSMWKAGQLRRKVRALRASLQEAENNYLIWSQQYSEKAA